MKKEEKQGCLKTLFVWREASSGLVDDSMLEQRLYAISGKRIEGCPYCDIPVVFGVQGINSGDIYWCKCPLCGWEATLTNGYAMGLSASWYRMVVVNEFDINSPNLAIEELATHLHHHYSDVFFLRWDIFERLVGDVFKAHGYNVQYTKLSRDGGADLILLGQDDEISGIVECKKYASHRSVGVGLVRSLVGAAIAWPTKRALLVTSTQFTSGARAAAKKYRDEGFVVELIGATELLELLNVYNCELPLQGLNDEVRREMIGINTRAISEQGLSFLSMR